MSACDANTSPSFYVLLPPLLLAENHNSSQWCAGTWAWLVRAVSSMQQWVTDARGYKDRDTQGAIGAVFSV